MNRATLEFLVESLSDKVQSLEKQLQEERSRIMKMEVDHQAHNDYMYEESRKNDEVMRHKNQLIQALQKDNEKLKKKIEELEEVIKEMGE